MQLALQDSSLKIRNPPDDDADFGFPADVNEPNDKGMELGANQTQKINLNVKIMGD